MSAELGRSKQIVIVTGINGSIGSSIAGSLLRQGIDVIGVYNLAIDTIEQIYSDMPIDDRGQLYLVQDKNLTQLVSEVLRILKDNFHGTVTGFVHTAARIPQPKKFEYSHWADFSNEFQTQIGMFHALLGGLINNQQVANDLSVVAISTIYAHNIPPTLLSEYVTIKAALNGLFRALSVEYGPRGLRFNLVSPGMTESKMLVNVPEKARLIAKMNTPLRRIAQPSDIVPVVQFLLSRESAHITGQNISVAGGLSI